MTTTTFNDSEAPALIDGGAILLRFNARPDFGPVVCSADKREDLLRTADGYQKRADFGESVPPIERRRLWAAALLLKALADGM